MKSIIQKIWMFVAVLCASIPMFAFDIEVDGIYYNIFAASKTAKVTFGEVKYTGEISLPETIVYANHNLVVNGIDEEAFSDCILLTSITLPESITSIGADAFKGCSALSAITLPENITSIGSGAFNGCSALSAVTLPENITSISSSAFNGCSALSAITLPEKITSIGDGAFKGCSSLTDMSLPESVAYIGAGAFSGCSALSAINLPQSVTEINDETFYGCKNLKMILLPSGLESIGKRTFYGCESLKDLIMPNSINSIGSDAFWGCKFDHFSISSGISIIKGYSLWGCSQVNTLEIKSSSNTLKLGGEGDIYYPAPCSWETLKIHNLIIGRPIQYLEWSTRGGRHYKNPIINNPYIESITLSDSFIFNADDDRINYRVVGDIPGATYIYTFYWKGEFLIEQLPNLKRLNINCDNITEISQGFIDKCPNLEKIVIRGIRDIGKNCFEDFTSLCCVQLNDVENIKADAFSGCMSLKEIELPSTLKSLSNSIVSCPLESITLSSSTPPTSAAFPHEIYLSCVLNVPLECIETYQSASPWNNFWNLQGSLVPIESVLFDEDTIILDINETKMLQPIISPANATNKELEWACSDPSIVSVSEAGTITSSTREGEAMITAYACDGSGVSATIKVVVQNGAGISDILADESFSVSVRNGSIIINGKRDSDIVEIFNLHGQLITSSTDDIINLSAKGIYLVKSGSRSKKVIL